MRLRCYSILTKREPRAAVSTVSVIAPPYTAQTNVPRHEPYMDSVHCPHLTSMTFLFIPTNQSTSIDQPTFISASTHPPELGEFDDSVG